MKAALERAGSNFTIFGGEPLLVPEPVLEELWAFGLERFGSNGIQTNGSLINDRHIAALQDSTGVPSASRWTAPRISTTSVGPARVKLTREATAKTHAAIERLVREGLTPSLIVTLHRNNATADKLPRMCDWFRYLDTLGITSARLHDLEIESPADRREVRAHAGRADCGVPGVRGARAEASSVAIRRVLDIRKMLLGQDAGTTCVWNACDPYHDASRPRRRGARAAQQLRADQQGRHRLRQGRPRRLRTLPCALPRAAGAGGCHDCRFFLMCKGQCPGGSIDGDWRNRSSKCGLWMALFSRFEAELVAEGQVPISLSPYRARVEAFALREWAAGRSAYLQQEVEKVQRQDSGAS